MSTYPDQVHSVTTAASDEPRRHALIRPKWIWDHESDFIPLDHLQILAQWDTFETGWLMTCKPVLLRSLLSPSLRHINYTVNWELNLEGKKMYPVKPQRIAKNLSLLLVRFFLTVFICKENKFPVLWERDDPAVS